MKPGTKLGVRPIIVAAAVVATALASGCCRCKVGLQKAYGKPLTGHEWVLTQFEGGALGADTSKYSVTFKEDGTLGGHGNCNAFDGSFTYTGGENKFEGKIDINITDSRATAGCGNATDQRFMAMLGQVDYYRLDMYMLLLYRGKDIIAMLETDRWK